jgi:hypothetical protein
MPNNYPPLARLSSDIEDRRNQGMPAMLGGYIRSQLTPEKLAAVMAHPLMSAMDRANAINAEKNPVVSTPLGQALGLGDLGVPGPGPIQPGPGAIGQLIEANRIRGPRYQSYPPVVGNVVNNPIAVGIRG